ncbi:MULTISPECIES: beta-galactosidase [Microbacterium]|uniref:Beta-galactosidase n=1 Tax=Microbacterium wangchenii TaxID=2541726 RepID=A0ABX5SU64_9MICO|nr:MULTISPECIES: beta-galactosidase [Microbacterium]MCK6064905.1 beta-galactosidase [Microbacterium sp. EYE_512]QBR88389.1 beta-galactosidase [Microbacterium wangchenii]TFV82560.1 beta-galactosidase [Microbacterium sp. dk485]TXK20115.1 beta-galactosidase [Microbacterium wangchenii]
MIWYGCDYNPEQWDAATIDEDLRLMREAGVNLVTLGVFAWAIIEPAPGEYRFEWLDDLIDRLGEAGIAVDLATASASTPAWLGDLDPELASIDEYGRRRSGGTRGHHCPSSAVYRSASRRLTAELARRYALNPTVVMWHSGNEFGGAAACFCGRCRTQFVGWLRRRYGELDALNDAWGTAFWSLRFGSWDQIQPPGATSDFGNPAQYLDWNRFRSDLLLGQFTAERDLIKAVAPHAQVMTNFMGLFHGLDYWKWARAEDLVTDDTYPDPNDPCGARDNALHIDLMRSLAEGKELIILEQAVGAVQWRDVNTPKRPGQFRLWSMQAVARGAQGICQFQWRASIRGAETFHSGMVGHAGPVGRRWAEVVGLGGDLATIETAVRDRVDAGVAIMLDWNSLWARREVHGPDADAPDGELRRWHAAFFELGIATDFVSVDSDLDTYRLLVLPSHFLVSESTAQRISAFVAAGGHVVGTHLTGVVDDTLGVHLSGYPGPLSELFGVRVLEHWPLAEIPSPAPGAARISAAVGSPHPGRLVRRDGEGELAYARFAEHVQLLDLEPRAEAVATFIGGDLEAAPVITSRAHGAGRATYLAASLDEASLIATAGRLAADAGIGPTLPDLPPGIEAVRRGRYLFLLNHGDLERTVDVTSAHVTDPADGRIRVAPRDVRIIALAADDGHEGERHVG